MTGKTPDSEPKKRSKKPSEDSIPRDGTDKISRNDIELSEAIIRHSPFGISILNSDEVFEALNPKFIDLFGYTLEDIPDKNKWFERAYPDEKYRNRVVKLWKEDSKKILKTAKAALRIFKVQCKNGRSKIVRFRNISTSKGKIILIYEDITSQTEAEKALIQSQHRLRELFDNMTSGIAVYEAVEGGRDFIIKDLNQALERFSKVKREDVIGKSFLELTKEARVQDLYDIFERVWSTGKSENYAISLYMDHNAYRWIQGVFFRLPSSGEIVTVFDDITQRKLAEDALRESETQNRAIVDASESRVFYIDKDMKILWANKTTLREVGISSEKLVGRYCYEVFLGRDKPCEGCPNVKARKTGHIERTVMHYPEIKGVKGDSYWYNYSVPIKFEDGEGKTFLHVARNITDIKRAEEHIHSLAHQVMKAQESERQRISRDLHDRIAQDLSTLKIGCATLFDNHASITPELRQKMSELSRIIDGIIRAVRDLAYGLRPPGLDQLGLVRTIYQYCEDFSAVNGVTVDFSSAGMNHLKLDFDTEINLYRLIQEALNNVKKHADASCVGIRLVASSPNIILRIEDDGKGFDVNERLASALSGKRMGIKSMEERVGLLEGIMKIQSRPGQGTKIFIEVPYKESA